MIPKNLSRIFIIAGLALVLACSPAGGNRTGHEFMPDMVHPVGYEANYYVFYYFNRWGSEAEYKKFALPRVPVKGTIARGYTGEIVPGTTPNGSVPYYYADTEDERGRAATEILENPFPITEKALANGKLLFTINCAICHGDKGDGAGYLARDGGKYPVAPANFLQDTFYNSTNGRYYHAIMYGKNLMGSYADKLSYEERWQVIHYIHALQAKEKKLQYNEKENTFTRLDIPGSQWVKPDSGTTQETNLQEKPKQDPAHTDSNPKH
ncbi:MAG: cytochrome c [Saprospiraceae bacterium]|nr:cytochrome c [Saprospiraceae bacterium]